MKKILIFAIIISALTAFTCCNGRDETITLERAEAFLPAQPDSADSCLCSITEPQKLNESQSALYGLLRTYTDNRLQKGVKSDSLIRGSYEHYHEASRAGQTSDKELLRRYAQSCYYMALFYYSCDSIKQCEDLLHQAIKGSERCEEWHTCYLAYTKLSVTSCWSNPDYAIRQSLKALEAYRRIGDDVNNEVLILLNTANMYITSTDTDNALKCYFEAYELAEKNNLINSRNEVCMGIANTYLYIEEKTKALDYAQRAAVMADSAAFFLSQFTLAECYLACDSLQKAKDVLESISHDVNPVHKYFIYRNLSKIALQTQASASSFTYLDSAYECLENRYLKMEGVKDEYYQANLAKELEKEQMLHQAELNRCIWSLSFIVVLLIASSIIYNVKKAKRRAVNDYQKDLLSQEKLLRQKAHTHAVIQKYLLEKMDHVRMFLKEQNHAMPEKVWKEIEMLLDNTDNDFVKQLRQQHPDFTEEDIRLCMLVRLKISNAAISNIYSITISAVKKRKLTLKKHGFNVTDSAITLEKIIEKL